MNRIIFVAVCTLLLLEISRASARPNEAGINSQESSQDVLMSADPRFDELRKEAENVAKKTIQNLKDETASFMKKLRSTADLTQVSFGPGECNEEAKKKLADLKDNLFKGLQDCPERIKLEQQTWGLGISVSLLGGKIQQAAHDSLEFCLKQKRSKNAICRINPEDEASKKFETLKGELDLITVNASKMYTDFYLPFVEKCFDQENIKAKVETIKSSCPAA